MYCEQARQNILERTLEGPGIDPGSPLDQHLGGCPACRAFLARLGEVDAALGAMPLERAPAGLSRQILQEVNSPLPLQQGEPFLPWTLWVPVGSFLFGLVWAYLALLWRNWPGWAGSFTPELDTWPAQLERWLSSQQDLLSAVTLCIAAGILFTVISVALGLYVGREHVVASS